MSDIDGNQIYVSVTADLESQLEAAGMVPAPGAVLSWQVVTDDAGTRLVASLPCVPMETP